MRWSAQQHNLGLGQRDWENKLRLQDTEAKLRQQGGQAAVDRWKAKQNLYKKAEEGIGDFGNGIGEMTSITGGG
jgi:hypothetical protein